MASDVSLESLVTMKVKDRQQAWFELVKRDGDDEDKRTARVRSSVRSPCGARSVEDCVHIAPKQGSFRPLLSS